MDTKEKFLLDNYKYFDLDFVLDRMVKGVHVYTDGGCRGNPGPAAIGVVICDEKDKTLEEYMEYIGHATNNRAEYGALIKALELSSKYTHGAISSFLDSELVVSQLKGVYRVKNKEMRKNFLRVKEIEKAFEKVTYTLLPRNQGKLKRCDELVNQCLDRYTR